jgi:hypothetical protein
MLGCKPSALLLQTSQYMHSLHINAGVCEAGMHLAMLLKHEAPITMLWGRSFCWNFV